MKLNASGFTVLGLLATLVGTAIVGLAAAKVTSSLYASLKANETRRLNERSAMTLLHQIQKIGRYAQNCARDAVTANLDCSVDFANPPSGILTQVRFNYSSTDKLVTVSQKRASDANFTPTLVYRGVSKFVVCDDGMMTGNTCPIGSPAINQRYAASLADAGAGVAANRFFRVQLALTADKSDIEMQGAFYVRNPGPSGLVYVWNSEL